MILDDIVLKKKSRLIEEKKSATINDFKNTIKDMEYKTVSFYDALNKKDKISIIAEIKKASPSKGIIKEDFDHIEIARQYYEVDVDAVSVLTEKDFFKGHENYLNEIRQKYPLVLLRKDFIIDEWQIYQARVIGADAILLIVGILSNEELIKFQEIAYSIGLECLVEVHDEEELNRALEVDARIIGINNRNLNTFEVDIKTTEKLIKKIPSDKLVVSESGIFTKEDIIYLKSIGANAVLIGESIMRSSSIKEKIDEFRSV